MMKAVAVFSAVVMASVGVARADGAGTGDGHVEGEVSPGVAVALSAIGTAASYATIAAGHDHGGLVVAGALGTLVLPSLGRWYAGSPGLSGMAIRGLGAGVAFAGLITWADACPWSLFGDSRPCDQGEAGLGEAMAIVGALAYAGGTIYDIAEASVEASEHNAAVRAAAAHSFAVVPVVQPAQAGHAGSYGLSLAGRF